MNQETICMDIRSFAEKVCKAVSSELGEEYQVKLQEVTKNNGVILQGLVILTERQNVSPTIYLNSFMEAYEAGVSLRALVDRILEIYREDSPQKDLDMSFFREFDKVKSRICYRLVNREKNRVLLDRIPHVDFLDLSVCFYYAYQNSELGAGSILIYNNHMEMWGCTVGELMRLAEQNTPRIFPWKIYSMTEILCEMMQGEEVETRELEPEDDLPPENDFMQILSNASRIQGAACVLYPKVMAAMAERMGGDFYILPSSVHEVILLRSSDAGEEDDLREMIREINATQVEPEEVLSDNLYFYSSQNSQISIK